jgi:hypothetical protein
MAKLSTIFTFQITGLCIQIIIFHMKMLQLADWVAGTVNGNLFGNEAWLGWSDIIDVRTTSHTTILMRTSTLISGNTFHRKRLVWPYRKPIQRADWERFTSQSLLRVLQKEQPLILESDPLVTWWKLWLHHDASTHFGGQVTAFLNRYLPDSWIGTGDSDAWPRKSLDTWTILSLIT